MLSIKLQAKPIREEVGKGYTGMLGGVYLTDATIQQYTAQYSYGAYTFLVELRIAAEVAAASANVGVDDVPQDVLKSVLKASKSPEKATELLAELALLRVLLRGA